MSRRFVPPSPGWISVRPMNQESTPGPVAMASHTCSGVASTVISSAISKSCDMSGVLVLAGVRPDAGVQGDHDPVVTAAGRVLVVVPADQRGDRGGQVLGEGGPVGGGGEAHLRVQSEGRQRFVGLA